MKKSGLNYIVDVGLVITFIISFTTAIIKFPGFLQKIGVNYTSLPMYDISLIHDWSGIAWNQIPTIVTCNGSRLFSTCGYFWAKVLFVF